MMRSQPSTQVDGFLPELVPDDDVDDVADESSIQHSWFGDMELPVSPYTMRVKVDAPRKPLQGTITK